MIRVEEAQGIEGLGEARSNAETSPCPPRSMTSRVLRTYIYDIGTHVGKYFTFDDRRVFELVVLYLSQSTTTS